MKKSCALPNISYAPIQMSMNQARYNASVRLASIDYVIELNWPIIRLPSIILQFKIRLTNSLVGRGHEGGSGSNKEGEKEEGTHLDSLLERLVNGLC
eukprot:scaffold3622_cov144-Skeletonema_menzelii.AAC.9